MITVRFPEGLSVQYNDAHHVTPVNEGRMQDLYTAKGGAWIARVPSTAIIEAQRPCRAYDALRKDDDVINAFLSLVRSRPSLMWAESRKLAEVKRELSSFNAVTNRWK